MFFVLQNGLYQMQGFGIKEVMRENHGITKSVVVSYWHLLTPSVARVCHGKKPASQLAKSSWVLRSIIQRLQKQLYWLRKYGISFEYNISKKEAKLITHKIVKHLHAQVLPVF
jgi:hypothetical protein